MKLKIKKSFLNLIIYILFSVKIILGKINDIDDIAVNNLRILNLENENKFSIIYRTETSFNINFYNGELFEKTNTVLDIYHMDEFFFLKQFTNSHFIYFFRRKINAINKIFFFIYNNSTILEHVHHNIKMTEVPVNFGLEDLTVDSVDIVPYLDGKGFIFFYRSNKEEKKYIIKSFDLIKVHNEYYHLTLKNTTDITDNYKFNFTKFHKTISDDNLHIIYKNPLDESMKYDYRIFSLKKNLLLEKHIQISTNSIPLDPQLFIQVNRIFSIFYKGCEKINEILTCPKIYKDVINIRTYEKEGETNELIKRENIDFFAVTHSKISRNLIYIILKSKKNILQNQNFQRQTTTINTVTDTSLVTSEELIESLIIDKQGNLFEQEYRDFNLTIQEKTFNINIINKNDKIILAFEITNNLNLSKIKICAIDMKKFRPIFIEQNFLTNFFYPTILKINGLNKDQKIRFVLIYQKNITTTIKFFQGFMTKISIFYKVTILYPLLIAIKLSLR
jgi:hypothetical protein